MALGAGVGILEDVETGLGCDIACALELDRRGSTSPSSWFTIADRSMVGGGRVLRYMALSESDWSATLRPLSHPRMFQSSPGSLSGIESAFVTCI
jgi:hypothetical protein